MTMQFVSLGDKRHLERRNLGKNRRRTGSFGDSEDHGMDWLHLAQWLISREIPAVHSRPPY